MVETVISLQEALAALGITSESILPALDLLSGNCRSLSPLGRPFHAHACSA